MSIGSRCVMGDIRISMDRTSGFVSTFQMVPTPHGPDDVITPGFVAAGQVWRVVDESSSARAVEAKRSRGRVAVKS